MSHILHHELTRIARDMKDDIHRVNRPCDAESIISHHIDRNAQLLAERIDATIVQGVNRPLAQMAEAARPWYIQLALDELRRVTERQVEERIKDLRRTAGGIVNDDDQDDDVVDAVIAEGVARTVDPLAARLDAKDRSALPYLATGRCTVECTCHFKVSARSTEAMIASYRDHTQFAHGQCLPVIQ